MVVVGLPIAFSVSRFATSEVWKRS